MAMGGDEQFEVAEGIFLAKHASKLTFMKHFKGTVPNKSDDRRLKLVIQRISRIMEENY
jgi:hypothetical protein